MAYDELKRRHAIQKAAKEYLEILSLACQHGEQVIDACLAKVLGGPEPVSPDAVFEILRDLEGAVDSHHDVQVTDVQISEYDALLASKEAEYVRG